MTTLEGQIINFDGKRLCNSGQGGSKSVIQMVSAWSGANKMVLGQVKVNDKSNEITAIPELLDLLMVKGSLVTIDAMGCQRDIAAKIIEKQADYMLAVKDNQASLHDDIKEAFEHEKNIETHIQSNMGHGRIEKRTCRIITNTDWVCSKESWEGLQTLVAIESRRIQKATGIVQTENRYYISSKKASAEVFNHAARQHWGIENNLHWTLDVVFNEDASTKRAGDASENFSCINNMIINVDKITKKHQFKTNNLTFEFALSYFYSHTIFSMTEMIEGVSKLFKRFSGKEADRIEKLPQSGSDRNYFRIYSSGNTFIATYNENKAENKTFISCTLHFRRMGLPMPDVFAANDEQTIYLQEDLGSTSLLDKLENLGYCEEVFELYKQTLAKLSKVQIDGDNGFNYNICLTAKEFGKQAIMSDLLYFKYYFLDTLKMPYDKQAMLNDFEALSNYLDKSGEKYFMYRDFQSRNVLVNNDKVFFIDYQGGMKGALQYDVASLLWQAKANLPKEWKDKLLEAYIGETEKNLSAVIDRDTFISQYNGFVLIRLLQVLGAYGFRGLFERKAHFLSSIPLALQNLSFFVANHEISAVTPELDRMLKEITRKEIIERFESTKANENSPLVVNIYSFSYKQNLPEDNSGNGGGFLFDMRGILNPGRFEAYKHLTGRDKEVKDFLEQKTKMPEYLNNAFNTVDITVEDYLQRDFANLIVGFGCTGGQHRSVYAADAMARHLKNKFKVKVKVNHLVQDEKGWVN